MKFKIVRFFDSGEREVVETGLTRAEAVAHCNDPETSCLTATNDIATARTLERGAWFDGFEREDDE